jgi:hypothetical protein
MIKLVIAICETFFDGRSTSECSAWCHPNRVLREQRGDGRRVPPAEHLVILRNQRTNLLGYLWIDRVFLLSKGRQSKLIATLRGRLLGIFPLSSPEV